MMKQLTTTLSKIAATEPMLDWWEAILKLRGLDYVSLEEFKGNDVEFPVSEIGKIKDLGLLCWTCWTVDRKFLKRYRQFGIDCANYVRNLMTDYRSTNALDVAQSYLNGKCTLNELGDAVKDAHDAVYYSKSSDNVPSYYAAHAAYLAADAVHADALDALGNSNYYFSTRYALYDAAYAIASVSYYSLDSYSDYDELNDDSSSDDFKHDYCKKISEFIQKLCDRLDGKRGN